MYLRLLFHSISSLDLSSCFLASDDHLGALLTEPLPGQAAPPGTFRSVPPVCSALCQPIPTSVPMVGAPQLFQPLLVHSCYFRLPVLHSKSCCDLIQSENNCHVNSTLRRQYLHSPKEMVKTQRQLHPK